MYIRAAPEEISVVKAQLELLGAGVPDLPVGADRGSALPRGSGVSGQWVNASGRSAMDAGVVL
jgi:hypothetical protein